MTDTFTPTDRNNLTALISRVEKLENPLTQVLVSGAISNLNERLEKLEQERDRRPPVVEAVVSRRDPYEPHHADPEPDPLVKLQMSLVRANGLIRRAFRYVDPGLAEDMAEHLDPGCTRTKDAP